jgi:hypothetical protein
MCVCVCVCVSLYLYLHTTCCKAIGQASITCLSLALAAVASSMRIFGNEKVTFRREFQSGMSTEAFCMFASGCLRE